jgi:hypothetical protein
MTAACMMPDDWAVWGQRDYGVLTACGEPATAMLTQACVHEHIDTASLCATCAAEIQRVAHWMICRRCEQAGHECDVAVTIEWEATP